MTENSVEGTHTADITPRYVLTDEPIHTVHDNISAESENIHSDNGLTLEAIIYIIIGCVGICGNAFVIIVILLYPPLRRRLANLLILNQSLIDLTSSVFLIAHSGVRYHETNLHTIADEIYCRVWVTKTFLWATLLSSTYNLVAITLERFFGVVHPLIHRAKFTKGKTLLIAVVIWILGPAFFLALKVPTSTLQDGKCLAGKVWPSEFWSKFSGVVVFVVELVIPVTIMIISYVKMGFALRGQPFSDMASREDQLNAAEKIREKRMQTIRINLIKTLAMVCTVFVLCWIWNEVWFLLFNFGIPLDFNSDLYHFTVYAVFVNCCINPVVYIWKYQHFHVGVKFVFRIQSNEKDPHTEVTNVSTTASWN